MLVEVFSLLALHQCIFHVSNCVNCANWHQVLAAQGTTVFATPTGWVTTCGAIESISEQQVTQRRAASWYWSQVTHLVVKWLHVARGNAARRHVCSLLAVKDSQHGGAQTFSIVAVRQRWRHGGGGIEALGALVVGGAFELTLRGVQGFELLGVFGPLVVGQGLVLGKKQTLGWFTKNKTWEINSRTCSQTRGVGVGGWGGWQNTHTRM